MAKENRLELISKFSGEDPRIIHLQRRGGEEGYEGLAPEGKSCLRLWSIDEYC